MKHYSKISMLFVSIVLISNIASTKIVDIWIFTFDAGTLLFPFSYIFADILTEIYGYKKTKEVIWTGFVCSILMSLIFMIVGQIPASVDWTNQDAYEKILCNTPRIVIASLIAYLVGNLSNAKVLLKIGLWTNGEHLWIRTIGSTIVGEFFDSIIFVLIAFYGLFTNEILLKIMVSNYIFKILVEILFTPVTYKVINYLKKEENTI